MLVEAGPWRGRGGTDERRERQRRWGRSLGSGLWRGLRGGAREKAWVVGAQVPFIIGVPVLGEPGAGVSSPGTLSQTEFSSLS